MSSIGLTTSIELLAASAAAAQRRHPLSGRSHAGAGTGYAASFLIRSKSYALPERQAYSNR